MSDFFGKLKSGAGKVAFDADKLVRVNRAKSELDQLNRQLETHFADLGKAAYRQVTAGDPLDLVALCSAIDEHKQRIVAKEQDIQVINAETYNPNPGVPPVPPVSGPVTPVQNPPLPSEPPVVPPVMPPSPAVTETPVTVKLCPSCGQEMPPGAKFCTNCGYKF